MAKVEDRVRSYIQGNPPLGCTPTTACSFNGTQTDWEVFRRDWINNCTAKNPGWLFRREPKVSGFCQAYFDDYTNSIRMGQIAENKQGLEDMKLQVAGMTKNIFIVIGVVVFIVILFYLLTSKK